MGFNLKGNLTTLLLSLIVVLMGVEIIYLVRQNRQLKQIINNPIPISQTLEVGELVKPFSATDLNGDRVALTYAPDQPYRLLVWFSSACHACEENLRIWNDLYTGYESERLRLIGICTDEPSETRDLVAAYDLQFPVIALNDPLIVEAYKGFSRPQTVLVGPQGHIRRLWAGSLSMEQQASLTAELESIHTLAGKGGD